MGDVLRVDRLPVLQHLGDETRPPSHQRSQLRVQHDIADSIKYRLSSLHPAVCLDEGAVRLDLVVSKPIFSVRGLRQRRSNSLSFEFLCFPFTLMVQVIPISSVQLFLLARQCGM